MSVDLQSVNVSIAGRQIVRDVCLQIRDGQRVGLIGSSGSGKSMIARAIMGLLPQDTQLSGSINVNGTQTVGMNDVQLARLRGAAMGMVFQNPAASLNPLLRVREQIELPLKLHYDLPAQDRAERVANMAAKVGLPADVLDRFPHQLSGGQQQRVSIATALITSPRLIIADEPTTALDSITQQQILELLVGLVDEAGASMLFVTHDFSVLASATQYCYVLREGSIVDAGRTDALLADPADEYTAMLVTAARALSLHVDGSGGANHDWGTAEAGRAAGKCSGQELRKRARAPSGALRRECRGMARRMPGDHRRLRFRQIDPHAHHVRLGTTRFR